MQIVWLPRGHMSYSRAYISPLKDLDRMGVADLSHVWMDSFPPLSHCHVSRSETRKRRKPPFYVANRCVVSIACRPSILSFFVAVVCFIFCCRRCCFVPVCCFCRCCLVAVLTLSVVYRLLLLSSSLLIVLAAVVIVAVVVVVAAAAAASLMKQHRAQRNTRVVIPQYLHRSLLIDRLLRRGGGGLGLGRRHSLTSERPKRRRASTAGLPQCGP